MKYNSPNLNHSRRPPVSRQGLRAHARIGQTIAVLVCLLCSNFAPGFRYVHASDNTPRVRALKLQKVGAKDSASGKVPVVLDFVGERFGSEAANVSITLIDKKSGEVFNASVESVADDEIVAKAVVPVAQYSIRLGIKGVNVESAASYELDLQEEKQEDKPATPFEITFETFKSEQYPNLYSLLIVNKSEGEGFSSDPNLMKVDVIPAGATNVTIQPGSNPQQMMVTFIAPEKFDVKGVLVTVYDPNRQLNNIKPVRFATPFKEKPSKSDPNQPQITNIDILSLQRRTGIGRLKIEGSGFGDYERPPVAGERELLCCLNRPSQTFERRRKQPASDSNVEINKTEASDSEVCSIVSQDKCNRMADWRQRIAERVSVSLVPRNPDLRVERTQILYIDDKVIDVYFEFTHFPGYSQPFRLQSATVTVNKGGVKSSEPVKSPRTEAAHAAAVALIKGSVKSPQTYLVTHDVGLKRDKNLEYRFSVLSKEDASRLFGSGVGDHFYVVELSIVNNGEKKVAIPLSAIQAEIEWAYGDGPKGSNAIYEEGPATISPMPLGAISGYFDAFQKTQGRKARLFNILDGLTTLGASLVPVFGRNIERPITILSGGLIPGLRKSLGDLSSQQLQNLTSMSWENIEEVPAGAGMNKFIYIQRGDQLYGLKGESELPTVKKKIMNIRGLEVAGFEVLESEKKLATQQQ
jgi:hypothetical protein